MGSRALFPADEVGPPSAVTEAMRPYPTGPLRTHRDEGFPRTPPDPETQQMMNVMTSDRPGESARRSYRAAGRRRRFGRRPGFEALEGRALLASFTWTGNGGDGSWSNWGNWFMDLDDGESMNRNGFPSESRDDVVIGSGAGTITEDYAGTIRSLYCGPDTTFDLPARFGLTVTGGADLSGPAVIDGHLTVSGGLRLGGSAVLDGKLIVSGGTILKGALYIEGGTLDFEGTQTFDGDGQVQFIIGEGDLVIGDAGQSTDTTLTIGSGITLVADGDRAGLTFTYLGGASRSLRFESDEPLRMVNGGQFVLSGLGTLDNSGRTLELDTSHGDFIVAGGATIKGGDIRARTAGSKIIGHGFTLDGVTLDIDLAMAPDPAFPTFTIDARVVNGLTLDGTMTLDDGSILAFGGTQTLDGAGRIVLGQDRRDRLDVGPRDPGGSGGGSLTIGSGITIEGPLVEIRGKDTASGNGAHDTIINKGTLSAPALNITMDRVENQGSIRAWAGGLNSNLFPLGPTLPPGDFINSGRLTLYPANSSGWFDLKGLYTQESAGILEIVIDGPKPGTSFSMAGVDFGQLIVRGTAGLDGTLVVTRLDDYMPAKGNAYGVLGFDKRVGDFAAEAGLDLGDGKHFVPRYSTYGKGDSLSLVVVSDPPKTATTVTSSTGPFGSVYGQAVTFTVAVKAVQGTDAPTGWVDLYDNGTLFRSGPYRGAATFTTFGLAVGTHMITAEFYDPDDNFQGSESDPYFQIVDPAATTTLVDTSLNPSVYGQSLVVTTTVVVVSPGAGAADGLVELYLDGTDLGPVIVGGGTASMTLPPLDAGTRRIEARYGGGGNFLPSTGSEDQVVNPAETTTTLTSSTDPFGSVYGEEVTFTATVRVVPPGGGTPIGQVFFFEGANVLAMVDLEGGVATFKTALLPAGDHEIIATFMGSTNFNGDSATPLVQSVEKAHTEIVGPFDVDSVSGKRLTIQPIVDVSSPTPTLPTGSLELFADGGLDPIATAQPAFNGTGFDFSRSDLTAGTHRLRVVYSGDPNFEASDFTWVVKVHPEVRDIRIHYGTQAMSLKGLARDLPFSNITAVEVVFSDDVTAGNGSLGLSGLLRPEHAYIFTGFRYDAASHVATWTLPTALDVDRLMASLDADLGAAADPSVKLAGSRSWDFAILPGDFDGDGRVTIADALAIRNQAPGFLAIGVAPSAWADVNGDGVVDLDDVNQSKARVGTRLPTA